MPKDNTHIYFADKIIKKYHPEEYISIIKKNINYYYLGSIFPDTFYYSDKISEERISDHIHGKDGNPTNRIIFDFLEHAKKNKSERELAFILGFISHFALDIVFHPVVYYLSGNYHDKDSAKKNQAIYLHRHLETYLDKKINNNYKIDKLLNTGLLKNFKLLDIYKDKFEVTFYNIERIFTKQIKYNILFRNKYIYYILLILNKLRILKNKKDLALFYENIKIDKRFLPEKIKYLDLVTGEEKETSLKDLFEKSFLFAVDMLGAAFKYYNNQITWGQCSDIIKGESLNTGKINCSTKLIKYTKFS